MTLLLIGRYLVCPNAATSFAIALYVLDYIKKHKQTMDSFDIDAFYESQRPNLEEAFENVVNQSSLECTVICPNSAHPGKFPYFVAEALNAPAGNIMPKDIQE